MPRARWYCEGTVLQFSPAFGEMEEIDLEWWSAEPTAEAAEDDARVAWSDDGFFPESVKVRAWG